MVGNQPLLLKTIRDYHQFRNLPSPQHPLISVVRVEDIHSKGDGEPKTLVQQFYSIALKRMTNGQMRYGQ